MVSSSDGRLLMASSRFPVCERVTWLGVLQLISTTVQLAVSLKHQSHRITFHPSPFPRSKLSESTPPHPPTIPPASPSPIPPSATHKLTTPARGPVGFSRGTYRKMPTPLMLPIRNQITRRRRPAPRHRHQLVPEKGVAAWFGDVGECAAFAGCELLRC